MRNGYIARCRLRTYLGGHHLGQGHALPLTARYSADELVPHPRLLRVGDAEGLEDARLYMLDELVWLFKMLWSFFWHLVAQGKLERLVDGQSREVDVV